MIEIKMAFYQILEICSRYQKKEIILIRDVIRKDIRIGLLKIKLSTFQQNLSAY